MSFNCIVGTPSTGQCRTGFAMSLARMTAYFAQVRVFPECAEQALDFIAMEGSGIGANRDKIVDMFLEKEDATHLLFIDDDVIFAPDCLHTIARRRQPIVACNYRIRTPPAEFMALNLARDARVPTLPESTGIEPVAYAGFGFCLMERKVLEALPKPRFLGIYTDHYSTEDSPFFAAAADKGFTCYIDHDASKGVAHHGSILYRWDRDYSGVMNDGE